MADADQSSRGFLSVFDDLHDEDAAREGLLSLVRVKAHGPEPEAEVGPTVEVRLYAEGGWVVHLLLTAEAADDLSRLLARRADQARYG